MTPRLALILSCVVGCGGALLAHKTVVSPYTFSRDVRPILEQRCGSCHVEGGVATPLLRYEEAQRASWPIRQTLVAGRMPPWNADAGIVGFKGESALTARELDILVTWAAGGTPEDSDVVSSRRSSVASQPVSSRRRAASPEPPAPDLSLVMPEPFTLAAGQREADHDVALEAASVAGKWIRAVDVMPGSPAIVRRASLAIRTASGEQIAGLWVPGEAPQMLEGGGAFGVPAGASLVLHVHYQRPASLDASAAISDRSRVGVYLANADARAVRSLPLSSPATTIDRAMRAVALRTAGGPSDATVRIVLAIGRIRAPLATLHLRPEWPRRYVFLSPLPIAAGSRVEMTMTPYENNLWRTLIGDRGLQDAVGKVRVTLESVE